MTKVIRGTVHWHRDNQFVWSRRNHLFLGELNGNSQIASAALDIPLMTKIKWSTGLSRRLFRLDVKEVIELDKNLLGVNALGSFYHLDLNSFALTRVSDFDGRGPLKMCFDGQRLIYGEYSMNRDRQPIPLFVSENLGQSWEQICVLNDVRHVHAIFYDSVDDRYWMTSGDLDHESHLRWTRDLFKTYETVHTGNQLYRAIDMVFLPDRILYGTDTPLARNYIVEMNRNDFTVKKLQSVAGSIFFLRQTQAGFFCTTAVEPSDTNFEPFCEVWHSSNGTDWRLIRRFKKDLWHATYFQIGRIQLPNGRGCSDGVWLSALATQRDGKSFFVNQTQPQQQLPAQQPKTTIGT